MVVEVGLPVQAAPMTTSKAFQTQKAGIFWTRTDIPIWTAPLPKSSPLTVSPTPALKAALELVVRAKAAWRLIQWDRVGPPPVLCLTRMNQTTGQLSGECWRAAQPSHPKVRTPRMGLTQFTKLLLPVQRRAWLVSSRVFVVSVAFRD